MTFCRCRTFSYMKQIFPEIILQLVPKKFLANNNALISMKKDVVSQKN